MSIPYRGDELPLMARAVRWKTYVAAMLRPWLRGAVLEVGAGIGANIPYLHQPPVRDWTALEPDAAQAARIGDPRARVIVGTLAAVDPADRYDAILYVDVLEHIADDAGELRRAAALLRAEGHLIVLAPAHPLLFSPMDERVGHYRRYTRARLRAITPPGCVPVWLGGLDSAGFLASLANRFVLRAERISPGQLALWDGGLVPVSRVLDRLLGYRFGKSLLAVWRRAGG